MSHTISLEQSPELAALVRALAPGEEIILTDTDRPVARVLVGESTRAPRVPGACVGMLTVVTEDDEHLKDFEEYM